MKKRYVILTVTLFLITVSGAVNGQTIEEIIEKHINAHGGLKNWQKIENMKITGHFTSFSERKPFTEIKAKGGKYYAHFWLGQHPVHEGSDGSFVWTDDPWFELPYARKASPVEESVILQKADFFTPFINYAEKGYKATFDGKEVKEGVEVFKITLTRNDGQNETWYLNSKTYLEYMAITDWSDFASPVQQEAVFDDFRKVGEVVLPFYNERVFDSRITSTEIENIELNVALEPGIFNLPLSEPMKKLDFLRGEWGVSFDALGRGGNWSHVDSTSSVFQFIENKNILQENISYIRYLPLEKITTWTFNNDRKNYLMTVFNDIYSSTDVYQGDFQGDSLIMDNTLVSFTKTENPTFTRYIFTQISQEGFVLEIAQSKDKGETWKVSQKFTYFRKK